MQGMQSTAACCAGSFGALFGLKRMIGSVHNVGLVENFKHTNIHVHRTSIAIPSVHISMQKQRKNWVYSSVTGTYFCIEMFSDGISIDIRRT